MVYYFKNPGSDGVIDSLIFCKIDGLVQLNFETEEVKTIYKF